MISDQCSPEKTPKKPRGKVENKMNKFAKKLSVDNLLKGSPKRSYKETWSIVAFYGKVNIRQVQFSCTLDSVLRIFGGYGVKWTFRWVSNFNHHKSWPCERGATVVILAMITENNTPYPKLGSVVQFFMRIPKM